MKKYFYILLILAVLTGCRQTNLVFMTITEPSIVTLRPDIKNIAVVKRCKPSDMNNSLSKFQQMTKFETDAILREGSDEGIKGMKDALTENSRFERVLLLDSIKITSAPLGIFPSKLDWNEVESICRKHNVDALFSLEMFDTELIVTPIVNPQNITNPTEILNSLHRVRMNTIVKTGFRIYYPVEKRILDEYIETENLEFVASGANPIAAMNALIGRKEAIKQTANKSGRMYATRLLANRIRVSRDYFIRGRNRSFDVAKRRARTGNWDGAAAIWKSKTNSSKRLTAGRACYNMAIINEINGDLDGAINWAQKSYEDYRIKLALRYLNVLKYRRNQANLLNQQGH